MLSTLLAYSTYIPKNLKHQIAVHKLAQRAAHLLSRTLLAIKTEADGQWENPPSCRQEETHSRGRDSAATSNKTSLHQLLPGGKQPP